MKTNGTTLMSGADELGSYADADHQKPNNGRDYR